MVFTLLRKPVHFFIGMQRNRCETFFFLQPDPFYSPGFNPLHYLTQLTRIEPDPMLGANVGYDPASAHKVLTLHQLSAYRAVTVDDDIDMARMFGDLCQLFQIDISRALDGVIDHSLEFVQIKEDTIAALAALYQKGDLFTHIDGLQLDVADRAATVLVGTDVYKPFDIMKIDVVSGTAIGTDDPALWQRSRTAGALWHGLQLLEDQAFFGRVLFVCDQPLGMVRLKLPQTCTAVP